VTWVIGKSLGVLGFGETFELSSSMLLIVVSVAVFLLVGSGYLIRKRISPSAETLISQAPVFVLKKSLLFLFPVWIIWGIGNLLGEPELPKQVAKLALITGGLITASILILGVRFDLHKRNQTERVGTRILIPFVMATVIHAVLIVYMVDSTLNYAVWYFGNWFIVVSLLLGFMIEYFDSSIIISKFHAAFRASLTIWLVIGFAVAGYQSFALVTTEPLTPPFEINGMYTQAKWIAENIPEDAIIASYNAGVIGYFSNHKTINLDGVVNNRDLLPYLFGPKNMTDYVDRMCLDYIAEYNVGPHSLEEIFSGDLVMGIKKDRLVPVYWFRAQGWKQESRTHIVLKVVKEGTCLQ